jgi:hypothetical protein
MSEDLGSLAQSARSKQLKTAKGTIIAIGVLTVVANIGMGLLSEAMVNNEVKNLQAKGMVVDQAAVAAAKRGTQLVCAAFAALGVAFIVMGFFVYAYPVPITVLALVLYLAGWAISAAMNPANIAAGIVIKIVIIVGLGKSIQAALAYERERSAVPQEV